MSSYALKDCFAEKLAHRQENGTFVCDRLGSCGSKKFSGFRTLCEQGWLYKPGSSAQEKADSPAKKKKQ